MSSQETFLHVGSPNIGNRERFLERVEDMFERRWLSNNGKYQQEFEAKIAELLGVSDCVATCNATVGLEIASHALGLSGEVIVPAFTFIATAHALQWVGLTPVFCDIDPTTHNLDPARVEALITSRTSAILGVHLWGRGCDVDSLQDIADRHRLKLMFDASHAFACSHGGRMIGGNGDLEVFSFHATKFINSFEGGVITTNNSALAESLRRMRNFGFTGYDQVECCGTNGKMSEISAAMGLTNLESLDLFIAANVANYEVYRKELEGSGLSLVRYEGFDKNNYQYVVATVDKARQGTSRDELVRYLHANGVLARRYFYPGCHRQAPYKEAFEASRRYLPHTDRLAGSLICLPTGSEMDPADIRRVCYLIRASARES